MSHSGPTVIVPHSLLSVVYEDGDMDTQSFMLDDPSVNCDNSEEYRLVKRWATTFILVRAC